MIDIDLRTYLLTSPEVLLVLPNAADSGTIQQNVIDQTAGTTRIWYQRRGHEKNLSNDGGNVLLEQTTFDLEAMSLDIDEAQELAEAIKTALHGHRGMMAATRTLKVEVQDHEDDYGPQGQHEDEGLHVCSLLIEVIH